MHRLTARFLLVLLLAGGFGPLAVAISAPPPHACCLRKAMHDRPSPDARFQAPLGCCQHDCCRPLTVSQWAHVTASDASVTPASSSLQSERRAIRLAPSVDDAHSGRAPPPFLLA